VKSGSHIWGTVVVLTLAIIGVVAGWNVIANHQAKIEVRQQRIRKIDAEIASAMETARDVVNKRLPEDATQDLAGGARLVDLKMISTVLENKRRAFNLCYENVSAWNYQRRQTVSVVFDLLDYQSLYAILTVVCAILGLYAAFSLQRCG